MDILRFTLSGRQAFFKNPDVNAYNYYTFGHIHKVALIGMLGAIMGYGGYNQMKKEDELPEFYQKLKNLQISVMPLCKKGRFNKKIVEFNNSVGYASKEQGGNLIIKQQWLEEPEWNIYIAIEDEESRKLSEAILNNRCVYVPYLGSNDHLADITKPAVITGNVQENPKHIDSLYLKKYVEVDLDDYEEGAFKYEETLPISIDKNLNMYEYEKFGFSNMIVVKAEKEVYAINDKYCEKNDGNVNIMFF